MAPKPLIQGQGNRPSSIQRTLESRFIQPSSRGASRNRPRTRTEITRSCKEKNVWNSSRPGGSGRCMRAPPRPTSRTVARVTVTKPAWRQTPKSWGSNSRASQTSPRKPMGYKAAVRRTMSEAPCMVLADTGVNMGHGIAGIGSKATGPLKIRQLAMGPSIPAAARPQGRRNRLLLPWILSWRSVRTEYIQVAALFYSTV